MFCLKIGTILNLKHLLPHKTNLKKKEIKMLFVHNKFKIIISTSFMLCQPRINFLFLQAI